MALDFRATMFALGSRVRAEDVAAELGVSLQRIKQARLEEGNRGRRPPPDGWKKAAKKLAERQAENLQKLAAMLADSENTRSR
jgi:hypothetical protein